MNRNQNTVAELSLPNGSFQSTRCSHLLRPDPGRPRTQSVSREQSRRAAVWAPCPGPPRALRGAEDTWPEPSLWRENCAGGQCIRGISFFDLIHFGTQSDDSDFRRYTIASWQDSCYNCPRPKFILPCVLLTWILRYSVLRTRTNFDMFKTPKRISFLINCGLAFPHTNLSYIHIRDLYHVISNVKGNVLIVSCVKWYFFKRKR